VEVGKLVRKKVLDNVIIGAEKVSLKENGEL
jgi:hypothetical protein